jgi:hypothetical protein
MVTYYTIFGVPAMSSICSALVTSTTMTNCSAVHVQQLALDMNWDGYSSQLRGTAITAPEGRAGEREKKEM